MHSLNPVHHNEKCSGKGFLILARRCQSSRLTLVASSISTPRFAVESQHLTAARTLSSQACPAWNVNSPSPEAAAPQASGAVDPKALPAVSKALDTISDQLQSKLSKKMAVPIDPNPQAIPVGSMIISGCILKADKGNAVGRMVGMNLGASHLSAHVVVLSKTQAGLHPVDNFDVQVKGGAVLPPLGPIELAAHAAREPLETLSAGARKLANQVLKKLSKDTKAREQAAKSA